jgi:hypothetical protein
VCGIADVTIDGVTAAQGADTVTFGMFAAGANNDCPGPGVPGGVVSVTVFGRQVEPAGNAVISVCLPRPDLIDSGDDIPLSPAHQPAEASDRVQLVDLEGDLAADCRWSLGGAPDGTARFDGFCDDGTHPDGFALTFDATVPVTKTCTGLPDETVEVILAGTVAVEPQ